MDWVKFVVPLIAVAVWILANLARMPREQQRPVVRRPSPRPLDRPDNPTAAPQRTATDVDRFLEEVARRRQEAAERRQVGPAETPPLSLEQREKARPSAPPVVVPVARRAATPERQAESRKKPRFSERPRALPEVLPARPRPRVVEAPPITEFPGAAPAPPSASPPVPAPTETAAPPGAAMPSAADASPVAQVLGWLRGGNTLPACIILHEIFQPPLCRRPRLQR